MRRRLGLVPDCHQSAQWRPSLFFFFSLFISLAWFAGVVRFGGARRKRGSREDDSRRFRSVRVRMHAGDYRGGCRELCRRGQARGTALTSLIASPAVITLECGVQHSASRCRLRWVRLHLLLLRRFRGDALRGRMSAGCAVVPRAVARHMCLDGAAKSGERYTCAPARADAGCCHKR